ncbi:IQ domain-containing protein K-like [Xenia sp. Carnegie-2017]|uniref:IQ domain-containing protein K-like n=1 Tax=Xenia sp. Carnegie-2017 TaxID=2897299 RepID=UPI001F03DA26|nr:IQ domain-containing protein K-like [Xenia sp. Carnegie-2017]
MAEKIDEEEKIHLDSSSLHPSFESILLDKKSVLKQDDVQVRPLPDPLVCTAREYCEHHVFPTLLPAMQEMLIEAKENKVFEKRRTKFNACDYLTNYLYSHNPKFSNRDGVKLEDIPFVQKILAENPRPPIPSSLLLSDDEAATIIQAHYKGYKVRKHPEVQELRQYQKEMREEDCEINFKVADLWKKYSMEDVQ